MDKSLFNLKGVRFCLIFPPYRESQDIVFLKTVKKDLGKIPPLSLCAVAAILESYGAKVKIIDANALSLSIDEVIRETTNFSPDFLGFTLSTYQFHFALEWIRNIRAKISIPVIVGGPHVGLYPREILTHKCIDYCVLGDADNSLPELINSLIDRNSIAHVEGIAYRDNGGNIKVNNLPLHFNHLNDTPFPSRHLINNSLYYSLISKYKNFTAMTSSRGCIFQCTFCESHCIPYRTMSPKRIVDEMEVCKKEFNINEIDMFDGVFSVSKKRLWDICEEIIKRKLKISWSFRARADLVDKETLKMLESAGCMRIYYGIESGSYRILRNIKKNEKLECIKQAVKLTKESGIDTFGYFMIGNYGENSKTVKESMKLMLSLPLDYVQIAPIFYPPNTDVYFELMKVIKQDYWKEYTLNPNYRINFPIVGTKFNKEQIHSIARKMYLRFYLRPKFMIKFMFRISSLEGLVKSLVALFDLLKEMLIATITVIKNNNYREKFTNSLSTK